MVDGRRTEMSIRLFASDVDGTILPRGGKISQRTRSAVRAAVDALCDKYPLFE